MLEMIKGVRGSLVIFFLVIWLFPGGALAKEVGKFIQVEGQVYLFRGGKPPAVQAKIQDGVEPGDAIHTKDLSRGVVKLSDDSILTIAPNSQIIIEEYLFDATKNRRQASIRVIQGLLNAVVTRLFQTKEPDYLVKTPDAILGVRGTEWYVLKPADTDFTDAFNQTGKISFKTAGAVLGGRDTESPIVEGAATNPALGFPLKDKIALASAVAATVAQRGGEVLLNPMQFSRISHGQVPQAPANFTDAELHWLQRASHTGLPSISPPSTNPREFLNRIRSFIERQEQSLKRGGDLAKKIKDAVAKGQSLPQVIGDLMKQGVMLCDIMTAAVAAGVGDNVTVANAAMAAGADLKEVRAALACMGYAKADTYTYTPPAPPVPTFAMPTPTALGGGQGAGASPSR
jgi:hypothetical protein